MIDYSRFHNYLCDLVALYQRTGSLRGMSDVARRWHCKALTKEQFYQFDLDKVTTTQLTQQQTRNIRDMIDGGAHRHSIVHTTVIPVPQFTITEPTDEPMPKFRAGQILCRQGGGMMLVSMIADDRIHWRYELIQTVESPSFIIENDDSTTSYIHNPNLRLATKEEVSQFLSALTRAGYEWNADNARGLFSVCHPKQKISPKVFANDLPDGYDGLFTLPIVAPSPYRYALRSECPVDNTEDYMTDRMEQCPELAEAIQQQMRNVTGDVARGGFYRIRELREYSLPTLCWNDTDMREHTVAFVKDDNNGTSYWLSHDRDVLRLLAWVAFLVK